MIGHGMTVIRVGHGMTVMQVTIVIGIEITWCVRTHVRTYVHKDWLPAKLLLVSFYECTRVRTYSIVLCFSAFVAAE
jgi:uncharacterized membrane protein YecN with MAPEG domain